MKHELTDAELQAILKENKDMKKLLRAIQTDIFNGDIGLARAKIGNYFRDHPE